MSGKMAVVVRSVNPWVEPQSFACIAKLNKPTLRHLVGILDEAGRGIDGDADADTMAKDVLVAKCVSLFQQRENGYNRNAVGGGYAGGNYTPGGYSGGAAEAPGGDGDAGEGDDESDPDDEQDDEQDDGDDDGLYIGVKLPTGRLIRVDYASCDNINAVKWVVQRQSGIPIAHQRLTLAGLPVNDDDMPVSGRIYELLLRVAGGAKSVKKLDKNEVYKAAKISALKAAIKSVAEKSLVKTEVIGRIDSQLAGFMSECEADAIEGITNQLRKTELAGLKTMLVELTDSGTGLAAGKIRRLSPLLFGADLSGIQALHEEYGAIVSTAADVAEYSFALAGANGAFTLKEFIAIVKSTISFRESASSFRDSSISFLTEGLTNLNVRGA